jgi:hypothetical protein
MADRILTHLCDYALKLSYRDLPPEVIRWTKHIVMDTKSHNLLTKESFHHQGHEEHEARKHFFRFEALSVICPSL